MIGMVRSGWSGRTGPTKKTAKNVMEAVEGCPETQQSLIRSGDRGHITILYLGFLSRSVVSRGIGQDR